SGRSTTGSISFGIALVAGRNRVPRPATGKTALRTGVIRSRRCGESGRSTLYCQNGVSLSGGSAGADNPQLMIRHTLARTARRGHKSKLTSMHPMRVPFTIGVAVGVFVAGPVCVAMAQQPDNWLSRLFQPPPGNAVPAPGDGAQWSGQSGASGNPQMTADAIRAAAADFPNCLAALWPDAERRGITRATYERVTAGLTPDLSIMDKLDAQPEFTKAPWDYLDILVNDDRIARGRAMMAQYAPLF